MSAKPIFRWAGSKRLSLGKLGIYWRKEYSRYIEPFAGSAQLFYSLDPQKAILSDVNKNLIDTYKAIKKSPKEVYHQVIKIPNNETNYYKIRALNPEDLDQVFRAARFIYLNRFCFNGLYRTNLQGKFNVPYSGYRTGGIPDWDSFHESAKVLKKVKFMCSDFNSVILENAMQGDFVYMDPPYAVTNRRIFKQYNAQTFGIMDLERLSDSLTVLENRKVDFVVSYAYCKEALSLFKNWDIRIISTQRFIAGFGKHRKRAKELIVSNIL